jgi:chromate reductase
MTDQFHIAILVGSLRADSNSGRIAAALPDLAPPGLRLRTIPIGDLPLYSEDLDGERSPASYQAFRAMMTKADAVLFVTPEYNRSIPGGLKNAIDVASRPYGQGPILDKPAAIISSSPGAAGGFGANHVLRQSLVFLNMPVLQQPELYLGRITDAFDEKGRLTSDAVRNLLRTFLSAFEDLIRRSNRVGDVE